MFKLRGKTTRTILLTGGVLAVIAAPFASAAGEGEPVDGGTRNPSNNQQQNYTRETEIIANVNSYGTRQSNKSNNGGGAIYGCRSAAGGTPANNEPCIRSNNLSTGLAFEFETNGLFGGTIVVGDGGDTTKPFTTNATGVATGLNADRVDGRNGEDLLGKTEKAADADKLDGVDGAEYARGANFLFAAVAADGTVSASRGGTVTAEGPNGDNTFAVTFPRDVSGCSYTATTNATDADADAVAMAVSSGGQRVVNVDQPNGGAARAFHLQVIC